MGMKRAIRLVWHKICDLFVYVFIIELANQGRHIGLRIDQVTIFWWRFLAFVLVPFWIAPYAYLTVLYALDEGPCQWSVSRASLGALCWPDLVVPTDCATINWSDQKYRADYLTPLSSSIEALMIGHLIIRDAEVQLER